MQNKPKAPPQSGEARIAHYTTNTGHRAEFGLNWKNFDPRAVQVASEMLGDQKKVVGGFFLITEPLGFRVYVFGDPDNFENDLAVTRNIVTVNDQTITLVTSIIGDNAANVCKETMAAAADLEQCAAIALALTEHARADLFGALSDHPEALEHLKIPTRH